MKIIPVGKIARKSCRGDERFHCLGKISFPSQSCLVCYGSGNVDSHDVELKNTNVSDNKNTIGDLYGH